MKYSHWARSVAAFAVAAVLGVASVNAQEAAGKADLDSQPPGQGQGATTENPPDANAGAQTQTDAAANTQQQADQAQQPGQQQNRDRQAGQQRDRQTDQQHAQRDRQAALGITLMESQEGVRVRSVAPNSPAQKAGLQRGDLIRTVGEKEFESAQELAQHISSMKVGSELKLTIDRDGQEQQITATLAEPNQVAFRDDANRQGSRQAGQERRVMRPEIQSDEGAGNLQQEVQQLRREVKELRDLVMRFHGEEAAQQQQGGQPAQPEAPEQP